MENKAAVLPNRVQSIDVLRGLVMVIMALDHVRDFFHVDALNGNPTDLATTTPILFFTRWITHFCAPIFVFLSGASAFLAGQKKSRKSLSGFLIKRGLWLIFVEIVFISFALTFNPLYNFIIWQVIWAIGWSMVLLGLLVWLPNLWILLTGALLVFGHNITDYMEIPQTGAASFWWKTLVTSSGTIFPLGNNRIIGAFYAILPWTGVLCLGYAFGVIFKTTDSNARQKKLFLIGGAVTAFFILLRFLNTYGDPSHWAIRKTGLFTLLSFVNTTKYPCSLLYCCMTLGPAILFLAFMERRQNLFTQITITYGRVPFFYYVLHFYLIHTLCVVLFFATGYGTNDIVPKTGIFLFRPDNFGFSLSVVYFIWILVVAALYKPCLWFYRYKQTHTQWWLRYL